ncbi:MAG: SoxR reducing system RseC family protein [Actinobacteria bacterium]|nr:SoxR reducing system RseC family protein [Actinomycetota bacterium]
MQCTGTVLESESEIARVLIESTGCDHCRACGFGAIREKRSMEVNAENRIGAEKDDRVHLELSGKKVMSASAILFLIPFLAFIIGFLLGYYALGPVVGTHYKTLVSLVLAFLLLGLSYYPVHVLGERQGDFQFVIVNLATGDERPTPVETQGRPPERRL